MEGFSAPCRCCRGLKQTNTLSCWIFLRKCHQPLFIHLAANSSVVPVWPPGFSQEWETILMELHCTVLVIYCFNSLVCWRLSLLISLSWIGARIEAGKQNAITKIILIIIILLIRICLCWAYENK